jgi:hypothetical protein
MCIIVSFATAAPLVVLSNTVERHPVNKRSQKLMEEDKVLPFFLNLLSCEKTYNARG